MKDAFGTPLHEGDEVVYADTGNTGTKVELRKILITRLSGTRIYFYDTGWQGPRETWTVESRVVKL
jgi:hypothetical protein